MPLGYDYQCKPCKRAKAEKRSREKGIEKRVSPNVIIDGVQHKSCSKCKVVKPGDQFCVRVTRGYALSSDCKECKRSAANKRYRENAAAREAAIKRSREHYERNKIAILEDSRRKYKTSPDAIRAKNINFSKKKKEADPIGWRAMRIVCNARHHAKTHGYVTDFDKSWVEDRLRSGCEMTGTAFDLSLGTKKTSPYAPSVDRLKAGGTYTKDNVRFILNYINTARSNTGDELLLIMARAVVRAGEEGRLIAA